MISDWKKLYIKNYNPEYYGELCADALAHFPVEVVLVPAKSGLIEKGYEIGCDGDSLWVEASNGEMLYLALTFLQKCHQASYAYPLEGLVTKYVFPSRAAYVEDCSVFTPVWKHVWTPPARLLDYEEKKASFPLSNRPMCWAHRGGGLYYPENSIEAIISSIYMGADIMELDFRYTKDNRIVLMHWDTLHQSTDWEFKKGKNGLPESDFLCDWTYDQLMQLRLKAGRKFRADAITEYQIPTLEEVLKVCDGRAFFIMDKMNPAEEWPQIYECICKTGCYEAFAFAYKMPEEMVTKLRREMMEKFGKTGPYFYWRKHAGSLEREVISASERQQVFREFSAGKDTAIMTNYVQDLIEYIDRNF
ncbi:MAG: glycerophosphodiester phosphodiesterase family protein [Clostridia bacterium]|nr:glycerophosphodiester phosphodiesterase family protein [Clostridia bacterium]